MKGRKN